MGLFTIFLRLQHAPHALAQEELHWEPGPICCFPAGPSNSLRPLGLGFLIRSMGLTLSSWNPTENEVSPAQAGVWGGRRGGGVGSSFTFRRKR